MAVSVFVHFCSVGKSIFSIGWINYDISLFFFFENYLIQSCFSECVFAVGVKMWLLNKVIFFEKRLKEMQQSFSIQFEERKNNSFSNFISTPEIREWFLKYRHSNWQNYREKKNIFFVKSFNELFKLFQL